MNKFYAILTFGSPAKNYRRIHTSRDAAIEQASELKGTGTCSTVDVREYDSRAAAKAADISTMSGRQIVRF